jgi:sugar phosphate isomerase/epimerase
LVSFLSSQPYSFAMQTRRSFLKQGGAALFSLSALPVFSSSTKLKSFGIQLYTFRDIIGKDTQNVLNQLAAAGYKELEAYGLDSGMLFNQKPEEFKKRVDDLGMKLIGSHAGAGRQADKDVKQGLDALAPNWKKTVEAAKKAGLEYLTVPWTEDKFRKSADDIKRCAEVLNKIGEYTHSQELKFTYHNHAFEFEPVEGVIMYDQWLKETDPKTVNFEMDIYWIISAGKNPLDYFEKYPGRFPQWHVKDMNKADKKQNADVGTGSIDFISLFKAAKKAGVKHYFVEHETNYNPDPIGSAKNAATYLKNVNF